jgi:L-amino acid N-acyltransferase YncA
LQPLIGGIFFSFILQLFLRKPNPPMLIRLAKPADASAILEIYAPYVQNTSFTFETEVPPVAAFAERISHYLDNWPWLVCEIDGRIAGYAYGARYRERVAYQWCVESSVYVHDDFHKAGVGSALYTALIAILKLQGFRNLYAVINLPNDRSIKFHEKCGFRWFANYENVGYKLGKWKTVGWWKLQLNEYGDEPEAPVMLSGMDKILLSGILKKY